jgi:hypothetical protein
MAKLTKKEVISRLQKTLKNLKELPSRSFNYGNFVSKSKKLKDGSTCGTVCCVAGWYPKWFPEAGLIWYDHTLEAKSTPKENLDGYSNDINITLAKYHGISFQLVDILFYGQKEIIYGKNDILSYYLGFEKDTFLIKKDEVIQLFQLIINLIKKDQIDYLN